MQQQKKSMMNMEHKMNQPNIEQTLKILEKRKANFVRWNEELKGNYVGKIRTLDRRIRELKNTYH